MSQFDQLVIFSKVVETGSFTAAGKQLGVSANAISKQVTQLEERLGHSLLERSTRQLLVTEIGKIIYEKSKAAQQNLEEINAFAEQISTEPSGILTVVCTIAAGQYLLSPHIKEFLKKYPKIILKITLTDRFPNFNQTGEEKVDLAYACPQSLIPKVIADQDLVRRKLNVVKRGLYAAPDYLAENGEPMHYQDLQNHQLIINSGYQNNNLVKACEKLNIALPKILYINNSSTILNCVLQGVGIALLPEFVAFQDLNKGNVKKILTHHQEQKITTYTFYKKTRYLAPKINCFIDFFNVKLANTGDE